MFQRKSTRLYREINYFDVIYCFIMQVDAVYHEGIVRLSTNCANEAAKRKVKVYLEISDGRMASDEKVKLNYVLLMRF